MAAPTVPVTITYRKSGTYPPIYVAGSFSDPPWEATEMEYTTEQDGEHIFQAKVLAKPDSEIQYKFRIGLGDWWVVDEGAPAATDQAGNRNNVLKTPLIDSTIANETTKMGDERDGTKTREDGELQISGGSEHANGHAHSRDLDAQFSHQRESSTPIQEVANTAAEVADTAEQLDAQDGSAKFLRAIRDIDTLRKSSTPIREVADTAAEVADTAEKLDAQEGVAKFRALDLDGMRKSSTPIQEVANTAAEVADTAEKLDSDENLLGVPLFPTKFQIQPDELEPADLRVPLFAHECSGMFEDPNGGQVVHVPEYESEGHYSEAGRDDISIEDIDLNDPTLEKFPLDRDAIISTVQKIQTGLDEDMTSFEGVPLSPVVDPVSRNPEEFFEDALPPSPYLSPVPPRAPRRSPSAQSVNRLPVSLDAIAEEPKEPKQEPTDEVRGLPVVSIPSPVARPVVEVPNSPTSDDDEAVVLKSERKPDTRLESQSAGGTLELENGDTAVSTGKDTGNEAQIKKRSTPSPVPAERTETPTSLHHPHSAKDNNWLKIFLRVLFVDWIGGFISRLCGGNQKTVLATATGVVALGLAWKFGPDRWTNRFFANTGA